MTRHPTDPLDEKDTMNPSMPRPHQKEAVDAAVAALADGGRLKGISDSDEVVLEGVTKYLLDLRDNADAE